MKHLCVTRALSFIDNWMDSYERASCLIYSLFLYCDTPSCHSYGEICGFREMIAPTLYTMMFWRQWFDDRCLLWSKPSSLKLLIVFRDDCDSIPASFEFFHQVGVIISHPIHISVYFYRIPHRYSLFCYILFYVGFEWFR